VNSARLRFWSRVSSVLAFGLAVGSCGLFDSKGHCPPHGFEAGERFRVTVLSVLATGLDMTDPKNANAGAGDAGVLACAPLYVGDSFVMEAGPWQDGGNQCDTSKMTNTSSPFAADQVPYCDSFGGGQLELRCREDVDPYTCTKFMSFGTYPAIKPTDQVVESRMSVTWSTCESGCTTTFNVLIERLPPAAPDGG
jgi:hypothetical protein